MERVEVNPVRQWREALPKNKTQHKRALDKTEIGQLMRDTDNPGDRKHVFPHRDDRARPMVAASFRQMLNVLGWGGKYSPHATRTTGSTRLNEMGFSADWIERQLAHTEPNAVRRTYNHADHLKDRTEMMQQWANLLDDWKRSDSNVIPIKQDMAA